MLTDGGVSPFQRARMAFITPPPAQFVRAHLSNSPSKHQHFNFVRSLTLPNHAQILSLILPSFRNKVKYHQIKWKLQQNPLLYEYLHEKDIVEAFA